MTHNTRSNARGLKAGDIVLFQGDSITDAFRKPEEINNAYRLGNGYVLMVAAKLLYTRPDDQFEFQNRGISGQRLSALAARWQTDTLDLAPSVVSLLIGINDTMAQAAGNTSVSPAQYEHDYRDLLKRTRDALPGVRLILCEPFALPCGMVTEQWFEPLRHRQQAVRELAKEFDAVFVSLQGVFDAAARRVTPEYWMYDGVHPTAPGHYLLARTWLEAVCGPIADTP